MFTLCTGINNTNFDETLLLSILSNFQLTSLRVHCTNKDENIFMQLLQIPSIQETLEHLYINSLNIFECTSVIELLVEFKTIKTVKILLHYSKDEDKLEELKQKIEQFRKELRKKHSEIEISLVLVEINHSN